MLAHRPGHPAHVVALGAPGVDQRLQHLPERRLAVPRLVGVVGAREERVAVVVEHDRHRPAALPGHRRGGLHVDGVHVGPLLAVDLDADEVLVEVRRGGVVLERLVRHHVAPVARGVPDAQQHRHITTPAPPRTPPAPTPTSGPGCRRAGGDTAMSRRQPVGHGPDFLLRVARASFALVIHEGDTRSRFRWCREAHGTKPRWRVSEEAQAARAGQAAHPVWQRSSRPCSNRVVGSTWRCTR